MFDKSAVIRDGERVCAVPGPGGETQPAPARIPSYVRCDHSYRQWVLCPLRERPTIGLFLDLSVGRTYKLVNKGAGISLVFFVKIML